MSFILYLISFICNKLYPTYLYKHSFNILMIAANINWINIFKVC